MWACASIPSLATTAARLTIRLNPVGGAPRSDTNTKGAGGLSRLCRRNSRNSLPVSGWVAGAPPLRRLTCSSLRSKSLLPFQVGYLGGAQAMAVGHQDHERISTAVPVTPRRLDQPLDLFGPQMLSLAQVFVSGAGRRLGFCHCPIFSGWRHQLELRLCHDKSTPRDGYFPISRQNGTVHQGQSATSY